MMMGDVRMISTPQVSQEKLLAAHNLLRELEANESLTDDMRRVLAEMDSELSAMNLVSDPDNETGESVETLEKSEFDEAKEKLKSAHEKIRLWESKNSMIWESGDESATEYIESVEFVMWLVNRFRRLCEEGEENEIAKEIISQGEEVLQVAMARLEEELVHILVHRRQPYDVPGDGVEVEFEDLIELEAIPFVKTIKNTMIAAKYDQEFCAAYVRTQKEALEECLIGLGMETLTIEELVKMEWSVLDTKIKTWVQVIRTTVHVYLSAEKRLCDQVLGGPGSPRASTLCFVNTTKSVMTCLLNFGHAMALGPHAPEKLFYLLDMYEALAEVKGEVSCLFSGEEGSFVKAEFEEVMERLGDSARATFMGFGGVILSDPSTDPFPGGGVHPLTSYVMNYIIYLPDYCGTLNTLLESSLSSGVTLAPEDRQSSGVTMNPEDRQSLGITVTPKDSLLATHLRSIASDLKSNLEKKSQLYKDASLQHVFLMNNIHYIQQKVMGSEMRQIFGDEWIRTQIVSYQQHATSYFRTTWSSVVGWLKDEGISSGSGSGVKAILKDKIRVFTAAFEEVYRSQTGWTIRDEQLKEELRISISQRVILAYQSFIGRHTKYDIENYVKYDSEGLEDLLRDFFEGSQKSLHSRRR